MKKKKKYIYRPDSIQGLDSHQPHRRLYIPTPHRHPIVISHEGDCHSHIISLHLIFISFHTNPTNGHPPTGKQTAARVSGHNSSNKTHEINTYKYIYTLVVPLGK